MTPSMNGQSCVPPGFRFHPTEEELLQYYLRKKVAYEKIDLDVIHEIDLNKLEPWDIQEKCRIGSTPQNDWYFFSHKDKKYPTGTRTNRATATGFWKATGRDKVIYSCSRRLGMRKTLVFYKGRAPHGQKSDWIMHEYRLDDTMDNSSQSNGSTTVGETAQEDGWVVCRVFKKKHFHKILECPSSSPRGEETQTINSNRDGALDQILQYMGRACRKQTEHSNGNSTTSNISSFVNNNSNRYLRSIETVFGNGVQESSMQLPPLESPTLPSFPDHFTAQTSIVMARDDEDSSIPHQGNSNPDRVYHQEPGLSDWAAFDRLVASHFNGQPDSSFFSVQDHELQLSHLRSSNDSDLWGLTRSSQLVSDPLCHLSSAPI